MKIKLGRFYSFLKVKSYYLFQKEILKVIFLNILINSLSVQVKLRNLQFHNMDFPGIFKK